MTVAKATEVVYLFVLILVAWVGLTYSTAAQAQATSCASESRITESFSNGAVWDFCWESRVRENLVLSDVYYTAPGAEPLRILSSARLSQLHVAYDDSDVTYNDVTQYGLGGGYLLTLDERDCPEGVLLDVRTRPALCLWRHETTRGIHTANRREHTESLNLYSVSQVGAYAYILSWTFHANGRIEPSIGATGALQRSSNNIDEPYGRVLSSDAEKQWLSHTHNYYWRLDFDLGESAVDDLFSQTHYELAASGKRVQRTTIFNNEQALRIEPEKQASWSIKANSDENAPAYIIEPIRNGHRFERNNVEPYSEYDFFVTVADDCERFASQNTRFNPDCENNVLEFVDGENIQGEDIVLWHRVSFHHVPRDEDQRHMHTHWDGFFLKPRNILMRTDLSPTPDNAPPSINAVANKTNTINDSIHSHIIATDSDDDIIQLTSDGLPSGILMNSQGHFFGTPTQAGTYTVIITAMDDVNQSKTSFDWTINSSSSAPRTGGRMHLITLLLLVFMRLARTKGNAKTNGIAETTGI